MYVFLKEFCENQKLWEIFEQWHNKTGKFEGRLSAGIDRSGQASLFDITETGQDETKGYFAQIFNQIKNMGQEYPNYIFALTMGLGKTTLMATSTTNPMIAPFLSFGLLITNPIIRPIKPRKNPKQKPPANEPSST